MTIPLSLCIQIFLLFIALNLLLISYLAWRRPNRSPEARAIALLSISSALYCIGYAGEAAQSTLEGALFWLHIEYLGIPWVPALWLAAAQLRSGRRPRYALLFLVPCLTFVGQQSNAWHGWYDRSMSLAQNGPFWTVAAERGPIAWLNLAYLYSALLYGLWLYLFRAAPAYSRGQKFVIAILALTPLCGYLLYFFGLSPWGLDLAPATLGVTVFSGYLAIFRLGCFDRMPRAHSLVFNNIRDAVLLADTQLRIVDINPAARALVLSLTGGQTRPEEISPYNTTPESLKALFLSEENRELDLTVDGQLRHYDLKIIPLTHKNHRFGSAAILADVTAQQQRMRKLRRRAETDSLTGALNRRGFFAALKRACAAAESEQRPLAAMLLDFDHFKSINDGYGHHAGDQALIAVTQCIARTLREADLLGRIGGDEFAILLSGADRPSACEIATRLHAAVSRLMLEVDGQPIPIRISLGLVPVPAGRSVRWKHLLKSADRALYQAKAQGRNRVAVAEMTEDLFDSPEPEQR